MAQELQVRIQPPAPHLLSADSCTLLAHSYGKQTKMWDTLFGTARPRIECVPENVAACCFAPVQPLLIGLDYILTYIWSGLI